MALLGRSLGLAPFSPTTTLPPHNHKIGIRSQLSVGEFPSNALRRSKDPQWRGGFSLSVDLGLSRTGLALSKGFSIRPLTVLELKGKRLEFKLLEVAEEEEAEEFIVGLPKSRHGKETPQSKKVGSVAGRIAVRAAERGWRLYLQDEISFAQVLLAYHAKYPLSVSSILTACCARNRYHAFSLL